MRTGEVLAAGFWLAIALWVAWSGHDLGLGSLRDPGPGFMIFWVGVLMIAFSAVVIAATARQPAGGPISEHWRGTRWWLVPYVVALLTAYAWIMPVVGFMTTTVLFLFILFMTIDRQSWLAPPVGAVLVTAAAYIVFHRWLGTQLPTGELERWLMLNLPAVFGRS